MSPLLLRAGVRYHRRHLLQAALAVLGVALGVAVVVSVDVATDASRRAFALSTEAVTGRATHEIAGGPSGLPEGVYTELRVRSGIESIAPVIDRFIRLPDHGGATLRLLGVDPFAEAPFRPYIATASGMPDLAALLTRRTILLERATAARLGLSVGDTVAAGTGRGTLRATIGGLLEPADGTAAGALADVAIADIATAQELTGGIGVLDRIEVRAPPDSAGTRLLDSIRAALPPGARLMPTAARTGATLRLTRAFDTNLTALALVALVFGMFLIYNSVTFSLVQRRPLIGLLRAQGVTAREILALVLAEAAVLGVIATAAGIVLGQVLGTQLVRLVARTINDLYFSVSVTSAPLDLRLIAKAAVLGLAATILAALPPAFEAVRTRPRTALARSSLERASRAGTGRLAGFGAAAAALTTVLLLAPSRSITLGFAALFVLILAAALLTPGATMLLMRFVRMLLARAGPVPRMAAGGVAASLSRTAPAIAALSVAVAVGIAVTVMITSFRAGVVGWLAQTLQADLYISAPGLGADPNDAALDPALAARIAAEPGVAGVTTYRHASLLVRDELIRIIAVDLAADHEQAFTLLDAAPAEAWPAFERGAVLISEPIAFRRGLGAGDSITLPTDRGPLRFAIAATYRDYASEHGVIMIPRTAYDRSWDDAATTSLAVFVDDDADRDVVLDRVRGLPGAAGVTIRSNAALRAATLEVFDRTFVITGVLRLLALIVAFVGVTGALMALQLERAPEIRVLRTVGFTPAQVRALVTSQTALMGFAAACLALPLGLAMAWAMVNVINRRSFGWSFDMIIGAEPLLQAFAVGLGAALLAGLYPAWRMSRRLLLLSLLVVACAPSPGPDSDPARAARLDLTELLGGTDTLHARAIEPRPFTFPADHGPHPEFRTEWWYFTGSLTATNGRELGYQLTFFRTALLDSAAFVDDPDVAGDTAPRSAWRSRHAYMAHFAVSDAGAAAFRAHERFSRGGGDLAGARGAPFRVWLGDWHAESTGPGMFPLALQAKDDDVAIDLMLDAGKPLVLQGDDGLSRKGPEPGNASYYYSRTRMPTRGTIRIGGNSYDVTGASWLDREWSTSALASGVEGWDWLSLQLDDATELMLYRLRREDGTADRFSAGTYVRADGSTVHLTSDDFTMTPLATWSPAAYPTSSAYPTSWRVVVPALDLALDVDAAFDAQELDVSVRYWEGMVRATGTRGGAAVAARGYLELTGY